MCKSITTFIFLVVLSISVHAQVLVKWDELPKVWYINSAGYPADEPRLDSLYLQLQQYKLTLNADGTYSQVVTKTIVETGTYVIDKKKRELILTDKKSGKVLAYSVAELTPDVLMLTIGEKYTWMYFLSLTSHQ